tara:strand:+ start:7802 stop:9070 length:1269 start_codon:yes stop_codon:yes gene_type:complete
MSGTGLDLRDLQNGSLNTLQDSNATGTTGDPRRTTAVASLRRTQANAYAPDTIGNRSEYVGIVVAQYEVDFPGFSDKAGLLRQYQNPPPNVATDTYDDIEKTRRTAYKVFIPEIDPRPVPGMGDLEDPVTMSLPEVYANIAGLTSPIPLGSAVTVQYQDPKNLGAPLIVRVVTEGLTTNAANLNDRGCKKWKGQLAQKWQDRNAAPVPVSQIVPPGSGTQEDTPAQKRMKDHAKSLKAIRKQIFTDQSLAKKRNRDWDDNAILSLSDQQTLKRKNQSKIDQVAANLGMSVATLEKIFKKESGTFDPYAINHNTSATGLIQFMPEFSSAGTAGSLGTTVEELLKMGPEKQLDYVEKYFQKNKRGTMSEEVDWYFIVFYPKAIGKPDSYVIGNATTARMNPGYADPEHPQKLITRRRVKERWNA